MELLEAGNRCTRFIAALLFAGVAFAGTQQETTLVTKYKDDHHAHTNVFPLSGLQQGETVSASVDVPISGPPIDVMLQKWTCVQVAPLKTECGWPGFFTSSKWPTGDLEHYQIKSATLHRTITDSGQYRLYLVGASDSTAVHIKVVSGVPTAQEKLNVQAIVAPRAVARGQTASITVKVTNERGLPVFGSSVEVQAGGGKFTQSAAPFTSVQGTTTQSGEFKAWWSCDPCAVNYGMAAQASKQGSVTEKVNFVVGVQ